MANEKGETITLNKSDLWKYSTFILLGVILIGGILYFTVGNGGLTGNVVANPPSNLPGTTIASIDIGDAPVLGSESAPVTIVEFSDYECPFCGRHYTQTYGQIKTNYVDTGKVKIVFMDFPLSFHPNAQKAAEAAECAGEQGKYWEMHDKLFTNQATLSVANYKLWAQQIGLNTQSFNNCLDTGKMAKNIQDDFAYGQNIGVKGTPAFFVGNEDDGYTLVSGAQPYSAFEQAINSKL